MAVQKTRVFPNFYETQQEATMRLQGTIVLYEGVPHYVFSISDYKKDGHMRIYMEPTGNPKGMANNRLIDDPYGLPWSLPDPQLGEQFDAWLERHPNEGVIRKYMTSKGFNNYKPFRLGMCNIKGEVYYTERHPQRHTQQGLTQQSVIATKLSLAPDTTPTHKRANSIKVDSAELRDTIMGVYPSPIEALSILHDPCVENEAIAFHRDFSFIRGPIDTMFLGYKTDIIGVLPKEDVSEVRLARDFGYTKEVVEGLSVFDVVTRY